MATLDGVAGPTGPSPTVFQATGVLPEVRPAAVPEVERRTTSRFPRFQLDESITIRGDRGDGDWRRRRAPSVPARRMAPRTDVGKRLTEGRAAQVE